MCIIKGGEGVIRKLIITLIGLLLGVTLVIGFSMYLDHEFPHPPPQLFLAGRSPDGTWAVEVWRMANDAYPLRDGVEVIVVVKDAQGNELLRRRIDERDRWEDVEKRYTEVIITNMTIKVGPHWLRYNPANPSYYTIRKADVDVKKFLDDKNKK